VVGPDEIEVGLAIVAVLAVLRDGPATAPLRVIATGLVLGSARPAVRATAMAPSEAGPGAGATLIVIPVVRVPAAMIEDAQPRRAAIPGATLIVIPGLAAGRATLATAAEPIVIPAGRVPAAMIEDAQPRRAAIPGATLIVIPGLAAARATLATAAEPIVIPAGRVPAMTADAADSRDLPPGARIAVLEAAVLSIEGIRARIAAPRQVATVAHPPVRVEEATIAPVSAALIEADALLEEDGPMAAARRAMDMVRGAQTAPHRVRVQSVATTNTCVRRRCRGIWTFVSCLVVSGRNYAACHRRRPRWLVATC
jgi:hypothetical protein